MTNVVWTRTGALKKEEGKVVWGRTGAHYAPTTVISLTVNNVNLLIVVENIDLDFFVSSNIIKPIISNVVYNVVLGDLGLTSEDE